MAHKNADLWKQYAEDAANHDKPWELWEFLAGTHWLPCSETTLMFHPEVKYRRKPTKKPVDLSVLIESGIDCEFWDDCYGNKHIGKLLSARSANDFPYTNACGGDYQFCGPRYNHWHAWLGMGGCPLPDVFKVAVRLRNGTFDSGLCGDFGWRDTDSDGDIIAFKVTGVADSHCMPWEADNDN